MAGAGDGCSRPLVPRSGYGALLSPCIVQAGPRWSSVKQWTAVRERNAGYEDHRKSRESVALSSQEHARRGGGRRIHGICWYLWGSPLRLQECGESQRISLSDRTGAARDAAVSPAVPSSRSGGTAPQSARRRAPRAWPEPEPHVCGLDIGENYLRQDLCQGKHTRRIDAKSLWVPERRFGTLLRRQARRRAHRLDRFPQEALQH